MTDQTKPQRVSVKFFADPDPGATLELDPFIGLFHGFIQEGALPGLLLDVADYAHVPDGPGVMLIGHEIDYAIDRTGGRTGLLAVRKRCGDAPLADSLRSVLQLGLTAMHAIHESVDTALRFTTAECDIRILDRLAARNDEAGFSAIRAEVEPVLREVFGDGAFEVRHAGADDPRQALGFGVAAPGAPEAKALVERLGGAVDFAGPRQSHWDIRVEDLARMREDGTPFRLIDVRESKEFEICNLDGELIPLGELPQKLDSLDKDEHYVVHCRSGARSAKAVEAMRAAGFRNAWNVRGGILAWIDRIDPSLTRY